MKDSNQYTNKEIDIQKVHDQLYIGSTSGVHTIHLSRIKEIGITSILNLMVTLYYVPLPEFNFLHAGFEDEEPIPEECIKKSLDFIDIEIMSGLRWQPSRQGF